MIRVSEVLRSKYGTSYKVQQYRKYMPYSTVQVQQYREYSHTAVCCICLCNTRTSGESKLEVVHNLCFERTFASARSHNPIGMGTETSTSSSIVVPVKSDMKASIRSR